MREHAQPAAHGRTGRDFQFFPVLEIFPRICGIVRQFRIFPIFRRVYSVHPAPRVFFPSRPHMRGFPCIQRAYGPIFLHPLSLKNIFTARFRRKFFLEKIFFFSNIFFFIKKIYFPILLYNKLYKKSNKKILDFFKKICYNLQKTLFYIFLLQASEFATIFSGLANYSKPANFGRLAISPSKWCICDLIGASTEILN